MSSDDRVIKSIGFDADDTLWHTENMFQDTQIRLSEMMNAYADKEAVQEHLHRIEVENVKIFGYGIKGFTLSMIETSITMSGGHVTSAEIREIIQMGKRMLEAPLVLMPHAETVLSNLKRHYHLVLITKGDLLDQTNKIDKSGLGGYFDAIEVVSEKDEVSYSRVYESHNIDPSSFMMIGNSIPSDIVPVLNLGGYAVHIPYKTTAIHERFEGQIENGRFCRAYQLTDVPVLVHSLNRPITKNSSNVI